MNRTNEKDLSGPKAANKFNQKNLPGPKAANKAQEKNANVSNGQDNNYKKPVELQMKKLEKQDKRQFNNDRQEPSEKRQAKDKPKREKQNKKADGKDRKRKQIDDEDDSTVNILDENPKLTALQDKFRRQLSAAKFRFLNERLYTIRSSEAVKMFKTDPSAFADYHAGFREQVASWPVNPVDRLVEKLKTYRKDADKKGGWRQNWW